MSNEKYRADSEQAKRQKSLKLQKRGKGRRKGQRRWLKTRHRIRQGLLR